MKTLLLVATMLLALPTLAQEEKTAAQSQKTETGFAHLAKYNEEKSPYDALMKDRAIQRALTKLMGPDYKKYKQTTKRIDISDPLVGSDGVLRVYGALPHLYTISETALMVKPNGSIYVAVLEDGERVLYYTNDKSMAHTLPKEFTQWSSRFSNVPVVYKSQ
jgi:hypothetical protein